VKATRSVTANRGTILRKRDAYRRAFHWFDPRKVARYEKRKIAALLADVGIVRNRAKIESAIYNAKAFLDVQEKFGTFGAYQWRFVDGRPIQNRRRAVGDILDYRRCEKRGPWATRTLEACHARSMNHSRSGMGGGAHEPE
jgi:3-methyladenine DNA glycosylase Tag